MNDKQIIPYISNTEIIQDMFRRAFIPFLFKQICITIFMFAIIIFMIQYDIPYVPLVFSLVWFILISIALLLYYSEIFIITDNAIYIKTGILSRHIRSATYEQITHTTVKQTIIRRFIWNTGNILISTEGMGGNELELTNIYKPFDKSNMITHLKSVYNKTNI